MSCYKWGLEWQHWLISIAFGFGGLIWGFCIKFIAEEKVVCIDIHSKSKKVVPEDEDEDSDSNKDSEPN